MSDKSIMLFLRSKSFLVPAELGMAVSAFVLAGLGLLPTPILLLLIIGWISLRLRGCRWHDVGLFLPRNWKLTLILAVVIGAIYQLADVFFIVPMFESVMGASIDLRQFVAIRHKIQLLAISLVLAWTLAAFGEELVFRGYLFNRLEDILGNRRRRWLFAAMANALIFGVAHSSQGIIGVIDNILVGLLMSGLYLISGRNLWLPIVTHGVFDTIGLSLLYLGVVG